ncbi:DUF1410 domain-containing protein [Ureaplasma urealyticum]|uniref:DUF1410 domain-containing protein n=1 Tax=Ureaplasma urealyticum TaxID=2130 RepID=A0AAP9ACI3_UREUR|nr:DUF1410 domain-containing protein [Ureaplasma urealyticum]QDI65064.1 DUF1410 domain-containing protein [Ureaplasma urealyticum]
MNNKKSKKIQTIKNDNNKKSRKQRLFLLLATLNLAWAGAIIGIVLHSKNNNELSNNDFYSFNDDGDLIIKGQLPKTYINKDVYGVFVDENNQEYKIKTQIDSYAKFEFDTKYLPKTGKYKLNRIIDLNNNIVRENEKLKPEQKIEVLKPVPTNVYEDQKNEKHIQLKVNKILANKILVAKFVNQNNEVYSIEAHVGLDQKIDIDTSSLKDGNIYYLKDLILKDSNPLTKVVNVNDIDAQFKKIDKTHTYDNEGNLVLKVDLTNKTKNQALPTAVFKDENNKEYLIPALSVKNNVGYFNTKKLPLNHKYELNRIVNNNDLNDVLVSNNELMLEHKVSVNKPAKAKVNFIDNKKVYEVDLGVQLKNTPLELTLEDLNHQTYKINAKTDEKGRAVFDISSLGDNNLYEVIGIKKTNEVDVVNLKQIPYHNRSINNLNSNALNTPYQYTKNGDINLIAKVAPYYVNQQVYGIFKDQNNQEHQILAKVKKDGTIAFDTGALNNNSNYSLDKIVSVSNPQNVLASNFDLTSKQKQLIKKPAANASVDSTKKTQILENLNNDLINQKLIATFVDNNDKEYKVVANVDQNNKIIFDSNDLPKGYIYHLVRVENNDLNKVINLNDFELKDKIIDKRDLNLLDSHPDFTYDNDGNLEIHTQLANDLNDDLKQKALNNPNTKGIVVDQDGIEHEIDVSIDANGKVIIPTKNLANNDPTKSNIYTLKKVVLKQNNQPNIDLISEEQLSGDNHISFKKPTITAKTKENDDYEISFSNPSLANKKIKLTFKTDDNNTNTKTVEASIGLDGKAIFKTSDDTIFAPDHKYTLTKIEADNKKVANIDEISPLDRIVNKQKNGNVNADNKHEFKIPDQKNKDLTAIYKDKNNNEIHVPIKTDDKGKVIVNPNNNLFDPNKIYDFDKIVDLNEYPNKTILDRNSINKDVSAINDGVDQARKLVLKAPAVSNVTVNAINFQVNLFDLNKLSYNRQFALTIAKVNDLNDTQKYIATYDPKTNNYKLNFDFTHLDANTKYKVVDVELLELNNKEKPIKLIKDDVLNFEFTTSSATTINPPIWTKFDAVVKTNNDTTITFEIDDKDNILKNDQKIYAQLALMDDDLLDTDVINPLVNFSKTNKIASINGLDLKGNSKYSIKNLYYLNDQNQKVYLFKNDVTKYEQHFITNPHKINLSFNKSAAEQDIFADHANLFIDYKDHDQKLRINDNVKIYYQNIDNTKNELQIGYGKVVANNKIKFNLVGLKEKTTYVIKKLEALNKSASSIVNSEFDLLDPNTNFSTSNKNTTLVGLNSIDNWNNDQAPIINAKINIGDDFQDNQQVKLIYVSNDKKEIESKAVTLIKGQRNYQFEFSNLIKNRLYTFSRIVYETNNQALHKLDTLTHQFSINPSNNAVSLKNNTNIEVTNRILVNNDQSLISAKIEVDDIDNVLTTADKPNIVYQLENDLGTENNSRLASDAQVVVENDKKYLKFNLDGLKVNQNYVIKEISFNSKPTNSHFNFANNKTNNIVYSYDEQNKISLSNNIIATSYSPQTINNNEKSVDIKVGLQADNQLLLNQYLRLKFKRLNDNAIVWSEPVQFVTNNNNEVTFKLTNLINNRTYKLEGLYYFENQNLTDTIINNEINFKDNVNKQNIEFEPSTTSIEYDISNASKEVTANSAKITFKVKTNDQALENDQIVEATFVATNNSNDKKVVETKLTNVNSLFNEGQLEYSLSGLIEETTYRLIKVVFKNKPNKAYKPLNNNNIIFEHKDNTQAKEFSTTKQDHKVISVTSSASTNTTQQEITVKIDGIQRAWNNKKLELVYESNISNDPEVKTSVDNNNSDVVLSFNKKEYKLTLNNLKPGRRYSLKKINIKQVNNNQDLEFTKESNVSNSFDVNLQTQITASSIEEINDRVANKLHETSIKINLNDQNQILKQGDSAEITYDNDQKINATVMVDSQNQKYLQATLTNLVFNQDTIIKKIEFKNLNQTFTKVGKNNTNVIYDENDVNKLKINNDFQIVGPLSTDANNTQNIVANNKHVISSTLDFKVNPHISKNLKFKLKFQNMNGEVVYSPILTNSSIIVNNNKNVINFTLANLKSNQLYRLVDVYYIDDNNDTINDKNKVPKANDVTRIINITADKTTITRSNNNWNSTATSSQFEFEVSSEDGNDVLENLKATIIFKKDQTLLTPIEVNITKENDKYLIKGEITNLEPENTYTLESIVLAKPSKTNGPLNVEITNKDNISFETKAGNYKVIQIKSQNPSTANTKQKITLKVDGVQNAWNQKQLEITYTSSDSSTRTATITLEKNKFEYEFELTNLEKNRTYTFTKIELINGNSTKTAFNKDDSVQDKFIVLSDNQVGVNNITEISDRNFDNLTTAKVWFELNDADNILSDDEQATITYDSNRTANAKVITNQNKKYLEVALDNLVLNQDTIINKIEFKQKPQNAGKNVGINNTNVIYEATNLSINNNLKISGPNSNIKEVEANNKANVSIKLELDTNDHITKNLYLIAKFESNDGQTVLSSPISSDRIVKNGNKKELTINLNNLKSNRQYSFKGLYYVNSSSQTSVNDNNKFVNNTNVDHKITIKPSITTIQKDGDWTLPQPNAQKFKFNINSDDSSDFSTDLNVTITFKDQQNTKKTITTKLKQNNQNQQWYVEDTISSLAYSDTYKLDDISINKPNNAFADLKIQIQDKEKISFTTQSGPTQLISLSSNNLTWSDEPNSINSQTITATVSGVNDLYNNRKIKLVYEYTSANNQKTQIESNEITLQKDQTTYVITLPINVANRQYSFKEIKIETTVNSNNYEVINNQNSVSNSFNVSPSRTELVVENNGLATNITSTSATITYKLKSKDHVFAVGDGIVVYFKSNEDERKQISYTKTITSVNNEGTEATITFSTDETLREEANYKLVKVAFERKPTLAHTNINSNENNVVFEDDNSNHIFKTSTVDHKVTGINSSDNISTTTQTVNINIDGIQRTWANQLVQLVYTSNDNEEVLSNQKTLVWGTNNYSFELTNLKHNRTYTLKEVKIIKNNDNSNGQIFPLATNVNDNFTVNRSAPISIQNLEEVADRQATNLTSATIKLTLNDPDNVLNTNDQLSINYGTNNKTISGNVSIGINGEKYVQLTFSDLTLNETTIINKISFNTKPNKAVQNVGIDVHDNNNVIYENKNSTNTWTINNDLSISGPLNTEHNYQQEVEAANKNVVTSTLKLKINKRITKNLKFKLKFIATNGDIVYSDLIDSSKINEDNGNQIINFTLPNLKSNQLYTFNGLYYFIDANNTNVVENQNFAKANNVKRTINIAPGDTTITKADDFSSNITANSAKIKFEVRSEDEGALSNTIEATVVFKNQNNEQTTPIKTSLKQINGKWIIEADINNLKPEITYTLDSISLSKPTNTANNLKVNINNKADINFKTAAGNFKITNITSTQTNINTNKQTINVNVDGIRDAWVGQKLQLVYTSNTNEEIKSDEQTITKNNFSYQFNFSNLAYNRKYTFSKLVIKQTNSADTNFDNTNNVTHNFIVKSKTPISVVDINEIENRQTNALTSAKVKFELNDLENVLSNDEQAQITYNTNKKIMGKIIVDSSKNKKYLEATLNDLVLNEDTIINKIEFITRPKKAADFVGANSSNTIYELTNNIQNNQKLKVNNDFIISGPLASDNNAIETKEYEQKNNVSSSITLKANPYIIKNLQFKLKFTNQNDESVESDWISNFNSQENSHTINFNLQNLKSNQTYSLANIYYLDKTTNQIINSQTVSKVDNFKKQIVVKPGKTIIAKEGSWTEPNTNNETNFSFNINSQDGNDVLENVKATIKFKNNTTQQIISTTATITKEKDKWLIKGKISNLDPNTKYSLETIELSKPTKTTNNLIVEITDKNNISFTTQQIDTQLTNLEVKTTSQNDLNKKTITATFSGVNDNFKDKQVKLIYKDNNNQVYESETITLVKNQTKYDFNLPSLIPNRKYTFDSIKISQTPNNNQSFIDLAKNSITNEFTIAQSTTNIEWIQPENDEINARGAKLTFKIKTQDAILTTNTKVEAYFAPVNAINDQSQWKLFTRDLTDIDQSKNIGTWTHDLRNQTYFDEETEYVLVKIKFKDKPSLAFANINNNADNIIYQYTNASPKYGFTTKVGDHKINSITSTSTTNNSVQNINVTLTGVKNIWLNKQMKLTYRGSDNELISSITNIVKSKTSYTFTLNNLKRNRVYHLEKVELVDNNTTTPFPRLDNITNSFIVERTEAVNVSGIEELENRNQNNLNSTVVKISLIDADNVLDTNEVVNISYNNNKTVRGTVKVQNKNKYIEAVFNDLVLNEDTVIKSINFANKPSKAGENIGINKTDNKIYDNVINTNKSLIINNNFKLVGPTVNTQITKEANQKTNITFDLDVNINPKIANNLRFKAKFRATNGEFIETNVATITLANNKQKINFTLTNLKANQMYTLSELYYLPNPNDNTIVNNNKVQKEPNVSRMILVNKGSTLISKFGEWNEISDTTAKFSLLVNSEDNNNELKTDSIATLKFKDNKNNVKTIDVNLIKEQNQWLIKGLLTQLNPETEYHLETISITKPSNLVQDLDIKIQNKSNIKFTTEPGATVLNALNVDNNAINTDTQTIHATFSGVNNKYQNRKVKLIYKDNNDQIYETNSITLSKKNKNYDFTLNNLIANRNYIFYKIQITDIANNTTYVDLKKIDNLTNSFKRNPSLTSIELNQPTNVTHNSAILNITLKSVDKVFEVNQQVIVYITSLDGKTLRWTRWINQVNNDKTQATINLDTGMSLNEQVEYKLLKVEFAQKPNLAYERLNNNNIIQNSNNNAKFTTNIGPTKLISLSSVSTNNTSWKINAVVSGVNNDYVGRKIRLSYKDNNDNIVRTNELLLEERNKKDYQFNFNNSLITNREYRFYKAEITNAKNSNTFIDLETNNGVNDSFTINPGNTHLIIDNSKFATNISENSATVSVNITSTDGAFENNQEVEARFESIENPSETKVFNGVLTNVSNDKNNATITWNLQGLKAQTEYKFIFAKFKTKPHLAKWELTPNKNNVVFGGTPEFKFRTMFKKPRLIRLESHNIDFNLNSLLIPDLELGKIKATISDFNDSYLNKRIRLIYESNDHKEWSTNELVLAKNKVEYEFDVKKITSNRKYTFRRIEIYNNKLEVLDNVNNVTDEFIYYNAPTTITVPSDLASNISSNNATFKLGLNSSDKILEDGQAVSVVLANKNYPNDTSKYKTYTTFLRETRNDGMYANIIHELNNLDEHSTYFIKEVKFINKPNKIIEHPNWNNKIFDSTKSFKTYEFTTKWANYNAEKKEPWNDTTRNSAEFKFKLTTSGIILNTNTYFKITFRKDNDQNHQEKIYTGNLSLEGNEWILKGKYENLDPNSTYTLDSIKLSVNNNFDNDSVNVQIANKDQIKIKTTINEPIIQSITYDNNNKAINRKIKLEINNIDPSENGDQIVLEYTYDNGTRTRMTSSLTLDKNKKDYEVTISNLTYNREYTLRKIIKIKNGQTPKVLNISNSINKKFIVDPSITKISNFRNDKYEIDYANLTFTRTLEFDVNNSDEWFIPAKIQSYKPRSLIWNISNNSRFNDDRIETKIINIDNRPKIQIKMKNLSLNEFNQKYQIRSIYFSGIVNNNLNQLLNNEVQNSVYLWNSRFPYLKEQQYFIEGTGDIKGVLELNSTDNGFGADNNRQYNYVKFNGLLKDLEKFSPQGNNNQTIFAKLLFVNLNNNKLYQTGLGLIKDDNKVNNYDDSGSFIVPANEWPPGRYQLYGLKYWSKTANHNENDAKIALIPLKNRPGKTWDRS